MAAPYMQLQFSHQNFSTTANDYTRTGENLRVFRKLGKSWAVLGILELCKGLTPLECQYGLIEFYYGLFFTTQYIEQRKSLSLSLSLSDCSEKVLTVRNAVRDHLESTILKAVVFSFFLKDQYLRIIKKS